jgi:hypothetical protein
MNTIYYFVRTILFISILFFLACNRDKYSDNELFKIRVGNHYGFIDNSGKVVISPKFDACGMFSEGLAYARKDTLLGFINHQGEFLIKIVDTSKYKSIDFSDTTWKKQKYYNKDIPFEYLEVFRDSTLGYTYKEEKTSSGLRWNTNWDFGHKDDLIFKGIPNINEIKFVDGLAPFYDKKTEKFGYMDKNGKYVILPKFTVANSFHEGLALVKEEKVFRFIDATGKYAFQGSYDKANSFSCGKAVCAYNKIEEDTSGRSWHKSNTMIINKKGEIISGMLGFLIVNDFHENIATIVDLGQYIMTSRGANFFDSTFNVMSQTYVEETRYFSEGLAPFKINNSWGFVDAKLNVKIQPKYQNVYSFSCGLAPVKKDGEWGYVNKNDTFVIKPQFDTCFQFINGLAYAKSSENGFFIEGYIDSTGKFIWYKERH